MHPSLSTKEATPTWIEPESSPGAFDQCLVLSSPPHVDLLSSEKGETPSPKALNPSPNEIPVSATCSPPSRTFDLRESSTGFTCGRFVSRWSRKQWGKGGRKSHPSHYFPVNEQMLHAHQRIIHRKRLIESQLLPLVPLAPLQHFPSMKDFVSFLAVVGAHIDSIVFKVFQKYGLSSKHWQDIPELRRSDLEGLPSGQSIQSPQS